MLQDEFHFGLGHWNVLQLRGMHRNSFVVHALLPVLCNINVMSWVMYQIHWKEIAK